MSEFDRLDFRTDDVLRADDLNAIVAAVKARLGAIEGGSGVVVTRDGRGNAYLTGEKRAGWVGKANGNISAASGSAWGTGTVTKYIWTGSAEATTGADYSVLNPSDNTMGSGEGITSGKRCFVQEDEQGNLIVGTLEC